MNLSHLPFDTSRRFAAIRHALSLAGLPEEAAILDVGGHPGTFAQLVTEERPGWRCETVDTIADQFRGYTQASGAALPFEDGSFDAVVTSDTLEHVPAKERPAFLSELHRVSGSVVILGAPFHHPAVAAVEAHLDEAHVEHFGGHHPWLGEHRECGLPDLEETLADLNQGDGGVRLIGSAPLQSWLTWQWGHFFRKLNIRLDEAWAGCDSAQSSSPTVDFFTVHEDEIPFVPYRWVLLAGADDGFSRVPRIPKGDVDVALSHWFQSMCGLIASSGEAVVVAEINDRLARALASHQAERQGFWSSLKTLFK